MSARRRASVSAVLIVKDEQAVLARCLASVAWADEVVVYDTGSSDATVEIARRFTDTVVEGYWDDDFGAARNRALAHATGDWVLSIDADETFVSDPQALRRHLGSGAAQVYALRIANLTDNPLVPASEFTATRIFRRVGHHWRNRLHEQVADANGRPARARVLADVHLEHSGYADRAEVLTVKAERNVVVVRAQLADAQAVGDADAVAVARADLARSLLMSGGLDAALDQAEQAWASGLLPPLIVDSLANALVGDLLSVGAVETASTWVQRWRSAVGSAPQVQVAAARLAARRGDVAAAVAALDELPLTATDPSGGVFERTSVADLEVPLLIAAGERDRAAAAARRAVRAGRRTVKVLDLLVLGPDVVDGLLADLDADQWRSWAMQAGSEGARRGATVLELMWTRRPDDVTVAVCAAHLADVLTFEQAGTWSARLRRLGLDGQCTLVAYAGQQRRPAGERALAAALVGSAYADERAPALLARALAEVPPERRAELDEQLAIVAPGLLPAG